MRSASSSSVSLSTVITFNFKLESGTLSVVIIFEGTLKAYPQRDRGSWRMLELQSGGKLRAKALN